MTTTTPTPPKTAEFRDTVSHTWFNEILTAEEAAKRIAPFDRAVWWNGHQFETSPTQFIRKSSSGNGTGFSVHIYRHDPHEATKILYYPIDSRTNEADWDGAVAAYPNADNTAWLPRHTDSGSHHDLTIAFKDGVYTAFKGELDGLHSEIFALDPRDNPHSRKVAEYQSLVSVQAKVIEKVVATDATRHLGWYEQNPHPEVGHVTGAVRDALESVKSENTSLWNRASVALDRILADMKAQADREVETRWDREARLAKEAEDEANE